MKSLLSVCRPVLFKLKTTFPCPFNLKYNYSFERCKNQKERMSSKMKIIIDTDPGFDDAMAIGAALTCPNADVLAITCVNGNVNVDKACKNALKLRRIFNREDVPVHKGSKTPILMFDDKRYNEASVVHGADGMLGCLDHMDADESELAKQHAANCIVDLATKYKGEVSIVALGPLTNLALAIRLQPDLPNLLKEVIVLGGNYNDQGNVTDSAEFNFAVDPIAAHIVVNEYSCPVIILPWETVIHTPLSKEFNVEYCNKDNERSRLFKAVIEKYFKIWSSKEFYSADPLAMCVALDRQKAIAEKIHVHVTVELFGDHTPGLMVVDRRRDGEKKEPNIELVTRVHMPEIERILINSVL